MSESQEQVKVVFTPSGKRGHFAFETPVLEAARALGVDIDSVCGGRAICGRCQVLCAEGEFPKHEIVSSAGTFHHLPKQKSAGKELKRSHSMADA